MGCVLAACAVVLQVQVVQCGVRPKQPRYWKPKPLSGSRGEEGCGVGGGFQDCGANCKLTRLVINAFAAFLLLSRPSLLS